MAVQGKHDEEGTSQIPKPIFERVLPSIPSITCLSDQVLEDPMYQNHTDKLAGRN